MDLTAHFRMLTRYNCVANERLYEVCAQLDDAEYRKQRAGSLGSIHGLLNHILLGDRIWMGRFENGQNSTPRLNQVLYDQFAELRGARQREDSRIEQFFHALDPEFWTRTIEYTNSKGQHYTEQVYVACAHMFNHQTHHRGQIHVMLAQTREAPPSLDLHRIIHA